MKLTLDFEQTDIRGDTLLYMAGLYFNTPIDNESVRDALTRRYIYYDNNEKRYYMTDKGIEAFEEIVVKGEDLSIQKRYNALADRLRELYPSGRKATNTPWKGSTAETAKRLMALEKKFHVRLDDDKVYEITKKYVDSFKDGATTYMKSLSYFIIKQDKTGIPASTLLSMYQNDGKDEDKSSEDWTSSVLLTLK